MCRGAGKSIWTLVDFCSKLTWFFRIVEYDTPEQAQTAIETLSNQNLMGRLVYVREVRERPQIFGLG